MGDSMNNPSIQPSVVSPTKNIDNVPVASKDIVHVFVLDVNDKRTVTYQFVNWLKDFLKSKGSITFVELEMVAFCKAPNAEVHMGFCPAGAQVKNSHEARSYVNVFSIRSNTMDYNKPIHHRFFVPEGYSDLIWPVSGVKPPPGFFISNVGEGTVEVTFTLFVKCSGPMVHRWTLGWQTGNVSSLDLDTVDVIGSSKNVMTAAEEVTILRMRVPLSKNKVKVFQFVYQGEHTISLNVDNGCTRHRLTCLPNNKVGEEWTYENILGDEIEEYPVDKIIISSMEPLLDQNIVYFYFSD